MSIKSIPNGYEVDCRPRGRNGKRYRKRFKTKGEAVQFERWLISTQNEKGWVETAKDRRPLLELIELWFKYYGRQLKTGEKERKHLLKIDKQLGHPKAYQVTKNLFLEYRTTMLTNNKKPATINRNHYRLSGVFTTLIEYEQFVGINPLKGIYQLRSPNSEMGFLSTEEIKALLAALSGDHLKIAKISLATGGRWSEVSNLRGSNISSGKVTFIDTKNGKNRTVPISNELFNEIHTGKNGKLFKSSYKDFYEKFKSLNFDLPKGQAIHALRHTFASHFIMNGGNIITLQKILGHSNINQTMTYSHLAPDYLLEAIKLNPLSALD